MITVEFDDDAVLNALQVLQRKTANMRPALAEIGEDLVTSTKQRFFDQTDPDGKPWLGNSEATIERKGIDQPLTDEGILGSQIFYNLIGNDALEVGSNMKYAAMQQFGGTKAEFPHLWGDIPARSFLGISSDDEEKILSIIQNYLAESTG